MKKSSIRGLGGRIEAIRTRRGLSIQDVADELGCAEREWQSIEEGTAESASTHLAKVNRFAQMCGIKLDVLVNGSEWTDGDENSLFEQELAAAKDSAVKDLAHLVPPVTLRELIAIWGLIEERFEHYRSELMSGPQISFRKDKKFSVDEIELRHMLKTVRQG